jgi:hypothetical protein
MKIQCLKSKARARQGMILLVTLIFAVGCGMALAGYMILATQEQKFVSRSQDWNGSLSYAEAGVDEALAQMNYSPLDFATNNWGGTPGTNGNFGPVTRTLAGGSYKVSITGGSVPTIYSTGFVSVAGVSGQQTFRRVKVTTTTSLVSPFSVALGAVGNINMNGNSLITDSYNSMDPLYSTNGQYIVSKDRQNGSVATVGGVLNPGNDTIQGNVYLGPTASYTGSTNQVTGTVYDDYNIQFPAASLPTTTSNGSAITWQTVTEVSSGGKKPTYTNYFSSANNDGYFLINNSDPIQVEPGVTVTLLVTTTTFNPSSITIDGGVTNSGNIVMYQDSGSATLGGNNTGGAIGNRPANFLYYGLPGVTSITFSGTSDFVGAVYAPNASLTLNGGGTAVNICGAIVVHDATDNGHYLLHYDESLANLGSAAPRGYLATSWQEF